MVKAKKQNKNKQQRTLSGLPIILLYNKSNYSLHKTSRFRVVVGQMTSPLFKRDLETTLSHPELLSYSNRVTFFLFHHHVLFHRNRKRDVAKQCTNYAWRTHCNHSDVADVILKTVLGSFNPFCDENKDPMAERSDQCANYTTPPSQNPGSSEKSDSTSKSTAVKRDSLPYLLYLMFFVALSLYLDNRIAI